MIQSLYARKFDTIIDVKLGDTDADSYKYEPITRILKSMNQWQRSWPGGKRSRKKGTMSTVTTNRKQIHCFSIRGRNDKEVSLSLPLLIDSSHGREKGITPFSSTEVGKRTNCYHRCKVLLTDDPQGLATQSPARTGAGLGYGIRNRSGRLNCTPG